MVIRCIINPITAIEIAKELALRIVDWAQLKFRSCQNDKCEFKKNPSIEILLSAGLAVLSTTSTSSLNKVSVRPHNAKLFFSLVSNSALVDKEVNNSVSNCGGM